MKYSRGRYSTMETEKTQEPQGPRPRARDIEMEGDGEDN